MLRKVCQDKRFFGIFGICLLLSIIYHQNTYADAEIRFTANVAESMSISISDASKAITFSSISNTGSYGNASFSVSANINVLRGYKVSMYSNSGSTNPTDLKKASPSSSAIPTLTTDETVCLNAYSTDWVSRNTWGYSAQEPALAPQNNDSCVVYSGVGDSTNASILHNDFGNNAATAHNNAIINVDLGVMLDNGTPAGTYSTTLNFVMIADLLYDYNLVFDANGGSGAPDTMTIHNSSNTSYNFTIPSTAPVSISGDNFVGWSENPAATTADYVTGSTYTIIAESYINTKKLYAVYSNAVFSGITTMQAMTPAICYAASVNDSAQLQDTRDSKLYWVTKLADGNCWMTQNLDLILSTSTTLTPSDSDVSTNWTPNNNTQTTQYNGLNSSAIWDSDYNTTAHSYRPASDTNAGTSGSYGNDSYTYFSPVIMTNGTTMASYKSEAECVAGGYTTEQCAHWNVGTFYSWYAATAGTGNASVSTATNATDSICPKGWHLPSSTSSGEFLTLVTAGGITSSNITQAPYYFLRAGYYAGRYGAVDNTGDYGSYWSRTSCSDSLKAYFLLLSSPFVLPSNYDVRYLGMGVRCVAGS